MIRTTPEGFVIKEEGKENLFKTLNQLVEYYAPFLVSPFSSDLPKEP
jgi:hypothetical protein